jgi:hypothetical protein
MKRQAIHTTSLGKADSLWISLGGEFGPVRRTGEKRYSHVHFASPLTINGRRNDVPAKLLSRINQLIRRKAANDDHW